MRKLGTTRSDGDDKPGASTYGEPSDLLLQGRRAGALRRDLDCVLRRIRASRAVRPPRGGRSR